MHNKFEVGKSYSCGSICNHECIWTFEVVSRTEKTITLSSPGTLKGHKKFRPYIYNNSEQVRPLGNYSMCPVLSAEEAITCQN